MFYFKLCKVNPENLEVRDSLVKWEPLDVMVLMEKKEVLDLMAHQVHQVSQAREGHLA